MIAGKKDLTNKSEKNSHVNSCVVNLVHSVTRLPQKKGVIPNYCQNYTEIRYVKDVSCVGHFSSLNLVTNVPTVALDLPVGARLYQLWEKWAALGVSPKVVTVLQGLHPPLLVPAKFDQVIHSHKVLRKSPQEQLPFGGIASASDQKCSGTGNNSKVTRILE